MRRRKIDIRNWANLETKWSMRRKEWWTHRWRIEAFEFKSCFATNNIEKKRICEPFHFPPEAHMRNKKQRVRVCFLNCNRTRLSCERAFRSWWHWVISSKINFVHNLNQNQFCTKSPAKSMSNLQVEASALINLLKLDDEFKSQYNLNDELKIQNKTKCKS